MSRNSKNAARIVKAREISKSRQSGNPGPASTAAKHGKRFTYRTNPEIAKRIAEAKAEPIKRKGSRRELTNVGGAANDSV